MSIKHFTDYYNELQKNYIDMVNGLQELEKSCSTQMVAPEVVEQYNLTLQPIKDSFLTLQYVKYLLDKPNKKSKQKRYEKQYESLDKSKYQSLPRKNREMLEKL